MAASGLPAISPHSVTGSRRRRRRIDDLPQRPQERPRQRIEAAGDHDVAAVAGGHELMQVVGADRNEIDQLAPARRAATAATAPRPSRRSGARSASAWPWRRRCAISRSISSRVSVISRDLGDHRQHDAQLAPGRRLKQGAKLHAQQARPVEAEADRPPAHRRILFLRGPQIGQHLVAADIERAEGHRRSPAASSTVGVEAPSARRASASSRRS